jgi:hypothetical protein
MTSTYLDCGVQDEESRLPGHYVCRPKGHIGDYDPNGSPGRFLRCS